MTAKPVTLGVISDTHSLLRPEALEALRVSDRILHAAARLARSGRRLRLKISATWPWAPAIVTAWNRITAVAQAP